MRRLHTLAGRLVLGQALVILAGAASLALVATAIAPGVFHRHVRAAIGSVPANEFDHLDRAFQDSLLIALVAAVAVASATALAISLLLAARIAAPIRRLADAAGRVAHGERDVRVSLEGASELRDVSTSFNAMTAALERSELQRHAFISDVAHELRTPVATIDGYLEGLVDGVVQATPDTWTLLRDQTRRLRRLVDDLATVARAEEGHLDLRLARLSPGDLIDQAALAATPAYTAKGVHLSTSATTDEIEADPDRLSEVITNLLDNALRHTPTGGSVSVASGTNSHGRIQIIVSDSGEGVAPDQLERIFDRLHRSDASRCRRTGGSGLGLTLSRVLIEAHHGTIHAESDGPATGTRIVIDLPAPD